MTRARSPNGPRACPSPQDASTKSGPTGFDLKRELDKAGVPCVVGAVSKMLRPSGDRVKTDRRDATFLARMLAVGNIVEVAMPTEAMEAAPTWRGRARTAATT